MSIDAGLRRRIEAGVRQDASEDAWFDREAFDRDPLIACRTELVGAGFAIEALRKLSGEVKNRDDLGRIYATLEDLNVALVSVQSMLYERMARLRGVTVCEVCHRETDHNPRCPAHDRPEDWA